MSRRTRTIAIASLVLAAWLPAVPSNAQNFTGRIDVVVTDATGGVLPGVNVQIAGPMNQTAVTDTRGEAHFLNLNVGNYTVNASLQGFQPWKSEGVQVVAGGAVPLNVKLGIAGAQETVMVTAESPVIDTKKQTTATNITLEEIQNIPTARDPWVMMQTVPSIVMDRVNVGGSESGQQAGFIGKGVDSAQTTWNMDGIPITDMAATGASPGYYDFDMFQEMNVQTGGADPKAATGGIQLNFVMKSGTNAYHGNVKGYLETEGLQSTNLPSDLAYLGGKTGEGDRTDRYSDWGGEFGGPIWKDRWWFWGAYGDNDIRIIKSGGTTDRTLLKDAAFKSQAQLNSALRASFTYWYANKQKWGRSAGPTREQAATYDQTGPNDLYKAELNYVLGNNLFLTGRYAHLKSGFSLTPEGGMTPNVWIDDGGVQHASADLYKSDRPQDVVMADGNMFRGNHEIKFGFSWRKAPVHSSDVWSGSQVLSVWNGYPDMLAGVLAPGATDAEGRYTNFYVGDTMSLSRATINAGIRYDRQADSVLPGSLPAVPGFETLLPSITAPGVQNAIVWKTWEPRVGLTYALDSAHKTQLRATYSLFTQQLGNAAAAFMSVAQYPERVLQRGGPEWQQRRRSERDRPIDGRQLRRLRPDEPERDRGVVQPHRRLQRAQDARGHRWHRPPADGQLRLERVGHVSVQLRLQLAAAHRRDQRQLHAVGRGDRRPAVGSRFERRHLQRSLLCDRPRRGPARRGHDLPDAQRLSPAIRRFGGHRDQADEQPVDGEAWLLHQPVAGVLHGRVRDHRPDADAEQPEHQRG